MNASELAYFVSVIQKNVDASDLIKKIDPERGIAIMESKKYFSWDKDENIVWMKNCWQSSNAVKVN